MTSSVCWGGCCVGLVLGVGVDLGAPFGVALALSSTLGAVVGGMGLDLCGVGCDRALCLYGGGRGGAGNASW